MILPGSKATIADLGALRAAGLGHRPGRTPRRGGRVLGLCGGYQMLGRSVADPEGAEGPPGAVAGLGMLAVDTVLGGDKSLVEVTGWSADEAPFRGYEMHLGRTSGPAPPMLHFADGRTDGAVSADGLVSGCYVHGLFADDRQRAAWLRALGADPAPRCHEADIEAVLDALAAHMEAHVDVDRLLTLAR